MTGELELEEPLGGDDDEPTLEAEKGRTARRNTRNRWVPEGSMETAVALRTLLLRPWLHSGRDDDAIAAVRRNLPAIRNIVGRLGWVLVVERDLVRLRKSPPPRRDAWVTSGPSPTLASWFFLLVAAAEALPPRVGLAQLVAAARAAAAEATLPVLNDLPERRAVVHALRMLEERGIILQLDGDAEAFIEDDQAPVLLAIHHTRLAHVIANYPPLDPIAKPEEWLALAEREPDPSRRMRRRLVEDTVVYAADLDESEADWLSRRVRGDDGAPLAEAFGLHLERRAEGAAFVVPESAFRHLHELGPAPFPSPGTVPHAALMLIEEAALTGALCAPGARPGSGWRGIPEVDVIAFLQAAASGEGVAAWRRELAESPARLADEVRQLLTGLDLVRQTAEPDHGTTWWFSPATARWATAPIKPKRRATRDAGLSQDGPEPSRDANNAERRVSRPPRTP